MNKLKDKLFLLNPLYYPAWLGLGLLWSITRLPVNWQLNIGRKIGSLIYYCAPGLRHTSAINIKLCFPDYTAEQQKALVKQNFQSLGIGLIEAAMAWWLPDKRLNQAYEIKGIEHVDAALAKGKGIILIGPHFTCLELVGRLLGSKYSFAVMYRPHKKRLVSFIHKAFREKHYINYISRNNVRNLLNVLANNVPIWYAYDIDGGRKHSVFAPFFGIQTSTLTAVSRIVKMSGAAVIPIGFFRSDSGFKYEVVLDPAIENFPTDDYVADATRLNKALERSVRLKPDQYIWQYKRFKTRPEGEARFY